MDARIGDAWYCHDDDNDVTCYMVASGGVHERIESLCETVDILSDDDAMIAIEAGLADLDTPITPEPQ
jgi:hypothetical protein